MRLCTVLLPLAATLLCSCGGSSDKAHGGGEAPDASSDAAQPLDAGADVGADSWSADAADGASSDGASEAGSDAAQEASDGASEAEPVPDAGPCDPAPPVADDAPRTVLVAHPAGPSAGVCGRRIRLLRLDASGALADSGQSVEVGDCPRRVVFSPDGRLALVINNNQAAKDGSRSVVVLRHDAQGQVAIAAEFHQFATANPVHLAFSPDGTRAYVTDDGPDGHGGVHVLKVTPGCTAAYSKMIPVPAATATQVLPGAGFALVTGGQPPIDTTILNLSSETVAEGFDRFPDSVGAQSLALSPDGAHVLVPNASPYSKAVDTLTMLAVDMTGPVPLPSVVAITSVPDPFAVAWSPDGTKVLVTSSSAHKVTWLGVVSGKLQAGGELAPVELAESAAVLRRGPHAGLVLVSSVTSVRMLRFTDTGINDEGKVSLGSGHGAIIGDLAIEP